ncbi:hypothetical protein [Pontibacter ramchanderi]|uniref:Uncharacterized protein n=1 Tax=Pontibacter ramchanderi TaxID=1179743 RepID=A0A2N3V2I1_9BACT|nr:hypothetical protein [Pontibacter ramchanderi]PKV75827.1 hypothetical protein BD749_0774 [Pontibacter ramchanderi]
MTENEFAILDELYFVTSYPDLKSTSALSDSELCAALRDLIIKGYIRILYPDPDTEHAYDEATFGMHCQQYFYLATKAGLVVHNSI